MKPISGIFSLISSIGIPLAKGLCNVCSQQNMLCVAWGCWLSRKQLGWRKYLVSSLHSIEL